MFVEERMNELFLILHDFQTLYFPGHASQEALQPLCLLQCPAQNCARYQMDPAVWNARAPGPSYPGHQPLF